MMCVGYLRSGADDPVYVKLSAVFATLLQVACASLEIVVGSHPLVDNVLR